MSYAVLKSRTIAEEDLKAGEENRISVSSLGLASSYWTLEDVTPGEVYNVNGICKAATGEMKPLCRTFQFTTPCTRPNVTTLLLQSRARRELRVWLVLGIHPS